MNPQTQPSAKACNAIGKGSCCKAAACRLLNRRLKCPETRNPQARPLTNHLSRKQNSLELHLMRPVTLAQAEGCAEVSDQQAVLLDGRQEGLVNGLLVLCTAAVNRLLLCGC